MPTSYFSCLTNRCVSSKHVVPLLLHSLQMSGSSLIGRITGEIVRMYLEACKDSQLHSPCKNCKRTREMQIGLNTNDSHIILESVLPDFGGWNQI